MEVTKSDAEAFEILVTNGKHVIGDLGFVRGFVMGISCRIIVLLNDKGCTLNPLAIILPGNDELFKLTEMLKEKEGQPIIYRLNG